MSTTFSINGKTNRFYITLASLIAVFVFAFISAFFANSILAPVSTSDAESVNVSISNDGYYVSTIAHDVDLTLMASPSGALAVAKDTVTTETNCDNGYQLYLSSANPDPTTPIMNPSTHTVDNVPTNSLILEGSSSTSGDWFPVTSGSFMASAGGPQAFTSNIDTWGFAVPSGSTGLPTGVGAFDASYGTTAGGDVNPANKFAAVPLYTAPQLIQETSTPDTTGVNLDVYYGVYSDMNKTAGTYNATLLYSVLGKGAETAASVSPSTITKLDGTQSITITTPIVTPISFTTSDITATVDGTTCPVTAVTNTDASGAQDVLKATCTAPNKNTGSYDVVVNIPRLSQSFTITGGVNYSLGGNQINTVTAESTGTNTSTLGIADTITLNTNLTATGLTPSDITITFGSVSDPAHTCTVLSSGGITYDASNYLIIKCTQSTSLPLGTYDINIAIKGTTVTKPNALIVDSSLPAFWTITTMQEMTDEVCRSVYTPGAYTSYEGTAPVIINRASAAAGNYTATMSGTVQVPETTLIDYRGKDGTGTAANPVLTGDNVKTYTVRKLADGNCWMSEELYLPLAVGTGVEMSYNDGSIDTYTPTANASINTNTRTYTYGGTERWYYNWFAATAEKGTSSSTGDIDGSICPKGWKLPYNYTVSNTLSYGALTNAYGVTTNGANTSTDTGYLYLQASPLSLPLAGYYGNGSYNNGGSYGIFWSSTAYDTTRTYTLRSYITHVNPQNGNTRSANGFNVRCVATRDEGTIATISTMQDMNDMVCQNSNVLDNKTLTDTRDGKTYSVTKLADNNCWMTENLALDLTDSNGNPKTVTASRNDRSTFSYTPTSAASLGTNTHTPRTEAEATADGKGYAGYYYYNWYAATAEQGTASSTGDIDGSICPEGWKLPYNYTVNPSLSWGGLTDAYGITVNGANIDTTTGYQVLEASPIYLQRTGYYHDTFMGEGGYGRYWSSTASTPNANAYVLDYHSNSYVYPQWVVNRYPNGVSVRCVAIR